MVAGAADTIRGRGSILSDPSGGSDGDPDSSMKSIWPPAGFGPVVRVWAQWQAVLEFSMTPLAESDFLRLAQAEMDHLEAAVEAAAEAADVDIDIHRNGNVMELEFADGSKIIVNSQAPMQELWVAARAGGFHFRRAGEVWVDTRDGSDFYAALSRYISQQAGAVIALSAR